MDKKYEGKVMSEEELKDFVEHVGRSELYDSMWVSDVAMPAIRDRYSEEAYNEAVEKVDKAWGPYRPPSNW